MTTLAEFMIIPGADNRPPMLEKFLYDSWKSGMEFYMENTENGIIILDSVQNGPLVWLTITEEDGTTRKKTYAGLSASEKLQADCDCKATNIVLQGLAIPVFNQGDDPIACLNKAMAFLTAVASSRVIVQQEGKQGWLNVIIVKVKVTWRGNAWFKEKAMLAEAQEAGQILDEEQLAFLADPSIPEDVILEVPHFEPYHTDMDNQSVHAMQGFEQTPVADFTNNEEKANQEKNNKSLTTKLERYKERVKTFEQRLNIDLSTREKMIDSQIDDIIKEKLALKQQIDSLEQNLSNQIKEKESLLQTFTVGQSAQTVHMLTKPQVFYDDTHKQALGYQNPFYLKKAQRIKPTLYDGSVILSQYVASLVFDDEETLILKENCLMNKLSGYKLHTLILTNLLCHLSKLRPLGNILRKLFNSMRENDKKEKVKQEMDENETINIELEHSVAKLLSENERLHKEIEHLKKIYKDQFDSIKKTRALSKEHGDSLASSLNQNRAKMTFRYENGEDREKSKVKSSQPLEVALEKA
ncbi:hypothetical protein Tco_0201842 [Tanacetum coccineum]